MNTNADINVKDNVDVNIQLFLKKTRNVFFTILVKNLIPLGQTLYPQNGTAPFHPNIHFLWNQRVSIAMAE